MKSRNVKALLSVTAVSVLALVGCLKDKAFNDGEIQSFNGGNTKIISLGVQVSQSSPQFTSIAYDNSNNDTTVDFVPVELGGPVDAPTDIHVTLVQADTLIDNYNNDPDNSVTDYVVPAGLTIINPGGVVTIPKGSRVGYLQVKFKPSDYIGQDVAIGFVIGSVAESGYTISSNLNTGIVSIVIKNQYDGNYVFRQQQFGWQDYAIYSGPKVHQWPGVVGFYSVGAASNWFSTSTSGTGPMIGFGDTEGTASFGAATPVFTFDPTTNLLLSIANPSADARNRAFRLNPAVTDSRYDPATKTIYMAYIMSQNGRPDFFLYDTLTYSGPR